MQHDNISIKYFQGKKQSEVSRGRSSDLNLLAFLVCSKTKNHCPAFTSLKKWKTSCQ